MTIHDNQAQDMSAPRGEHGQFHGEVIQDQNLSSSVIVLSYTDPIDPRHNLAIRIAPELGSNLFSYTVGDYELIYCDRELLKQKQPTGNLVLWPFPNRVRDKKYTYQGKEYSLADVPRMPDPMLVHGLVYDRSWQFSQPIIERDKVHVTTYVDMGPDYPYYAAYPFESRLSLTYTLNNQGVAITYTVENKGQQTLPFGFALHPYFMVISGKSDTTVSLPADIVMEADKTLLPTTRLLDVKQIMYAMFDLHEARPVGVLKLDHVYTALTPGKNAVIHYQKQQIHLTASATADFTHMVIYTPPTDDPYFCLENQTCATDAINLQARGLNQIGHLLEVSPGEQSSGTIYYTLSIDTTI